MILMFVGIIVAVIGFTKIDDSGYGILIAGIVIFLLGLCVSSVHIEEVKARTNRRRYWAYGEEPDWVKERRTKR